MFGNTHVRRDNNGSTYAERLEPQLPAASSVELLVIVFLIVTRRPTFGKSLRASLVFKFSRQTFFRAEIKAPFTLEINFEINWEIYVN